MKRIIAKMIVLATITIVFLFSIHTVSFSEKYSSINLGLPDISGVVWVEDDYFMTVHDAKDSGENPSPRVSLLRIPEQQKSLSWQALAVNWPKSLGVGRDLESITAIPETNLFLLAESGNQKRYQRLFLLAYEKQNVKIVAETTWPVPVENVEAIAVTQINDSYLFLYAERAEGQASTEIRWTILTLNPLKFGEFRSISFQSPFGSGKDFRQISDLAIDSQQNIYISSTLDLGNTGAFRSAIYQIGQVTADNNIMLDPNPRKLGEMDGLKVEGLAIRKLSEGKQIFFGTDDENYGGVLRLLP